MFSTESPSCALVILPATADDLLFVRSSLDALADLGFETDDPMRAFLIEFRRRLTRAEAQLRRDQTQGARSGQGP